MDVKNVSPKKEPVAVGGFILDQGVKRTISTEYIFSKLRFVSSLIGEKKIIFIADKNKADDLRAVQSIFDYNSDLTYGVEYKTDKKKDSKDDTSDVYDKSQTDSEAKAKEEAEAEAKAKAEADKKAKAEAEAKAKSEADKKAKAEAEAKAKSEADKKAKAEAEAKAKADEKAKNTKSTTRRTSGRSEPKK